MYKQQHKGQRAHGWKAKLGRWGSVMLLTTLASFCFAADEPVDVNSASAEEIAKAMRGVGRVIAQRVVDYRDSNGAFLTIDDLIEIRGIGQKTVERNRDQIVAVVEESRSSR